MSVSNIPVVYPTPWGWMLLLMVGVFGFVTQVSPSGHTDT